jgi:glycine betaine/choline ABC-type transport system substrate-binding protein
LQAALSELSGKLTTPVVRKLVAALDLEHRPAPDIAAGFLTDAGLK